jgi:hypothetical protein
MAVNAVVVHVLHKRAVVGFQARECVRVNVVGDVSPAAVREAELPYMSSRVLGCPATEESADAAEEPAAAPSVLIIALPRVCVKEM